MKKGCLIYTLNTLVAITVSLVHVYRVFIIPSRIQIDKAKYPKTGIDISKHNEKIDFKKLHKNPVDFIHI